MINRLSALILAASCSTAAAGTFLTATIDGSAAEWAGVPFVTTDALDNAAGVDINTVQLANDGSYVFILITYHTPTSVSTFTAVNNDSSPTTGFDVYGLGTSGSEAGWQNDFPFDQRGGFNSGGINGGGAPMSPAFNVNASIREFALPLTATFATDGTPVFPNQTFSIMFWSDNGFEFTAPVSYTLATPVPEPTSSLLAVLAGLACFGRRHRH